MLKDKCPNAIEVFDKIYEIETSARLWINISIEIEKVSFTEQVKLLFSSVKDTNIYNEDPTYQKRLFEKLKWFYRCSKEIDETKRESKNFNIQKEKLYDFDKDADLIFSAFYKTYHIDIEKCLDTIHWWKFMAMFRDLDESTKFVGTYLYYRSMDITKSEEYLKASPKTRIEILNIKDKIRLKDDKKTRILTYTNETEESYGAKLRREKREKIEII